MGALVQADTDFAQDDVSLDFQSTPVAPTYEHISPHHARVSALVTATHHPDQFSNLSQGCSLMTFGIHGLGLATPSTKVNEAEVGLCANALARYSPESNRRAALYADIGIKHRNLVLPRAFVDDLVNDTRVSNSVFLPDSDRPLGPTTGQRMAVYAQEAGRLAVRASTDALANAGLEAHGHHPPDNSFVHRLRGAQL